MTKTDRPTHRFRFLEKEGEIRGAHSAPHPFVATCLHRMPGKGVEGERDPLIRDRWTCAAAVGSLAALVSAEVFSQTLLIQVPYPSLSSSRLPKLVALSRRGGHVTTSAGHIARQPVTCHSSAQVPKNLSSALHIGNALGYTYSLLTHAGRLKTNRPLGLHGPSVAMLAEPELVPAFQGLANGTQGLQSLYSVVCRRTKEMVQVKRVPGKFGKRRPRYPT